MIYKALNWYQWAIAECALHQWSIPGHNGTLEMSTYTAANKTLVLLIKEVLIPTHVGRLLKQQLTTAWTGSDDVMEIVFSMRSRPEDIILKTVPIITFLHSHKTKLMWVSCFLKCSIKHPLSHVTECEILDQQHKIRQAIQCIIGGMPSSILHGTHANSHLCKPRI